MIYLDLIVMLNFLVDFLLLMGSNRLAGYPPAPGRSACGALLGGTYAGICVMPGFLFLGNGLWRAVSFLLVGWIAFGYGRSSVRRIGVFALLSMALGGLASASGFKSMLGLIICGSLLWFACRFGFPGGGFRQEFLSAELWWDGNHLKLLALYDTGNHLRDPLTGESVLVCGADVAEELLGIPRAWAGDPVRVMEAVPGARLIPYHAVGQPGGLLPAVRLSRAIINGVERKPLVAFAPEELSNGAEYRMLMGGVV